MYTQSADFLSEEGRNVHNPLRPLNVLYLIERSCRKPVTHVFQAISLYYQFSDMEFQFEYPHFCEQSKCEFSLTEMSPPVQARGSESWPKVEFLLITVRNLT